MVRKTPTPIRIRREREETRPYRGGKHKKYGETSVDAYIERRFNHAYKVMVERETNGRFTAHEGKLMSMREYLEAEANDQL